MKKKEKEKGKKKKKRKAEQSKASPESKILTSKATQSSSRRPITPNIC
jgi:hypothetical protein